MLIDESYGIKSSNDKLILYLKNDPVLKTKIKDLRSIWDFHEVIEVIVFPDKESVEKEMGHNLPEWFIGSSFKGKILLIDYDIWKDKNPCQLWQILIHEMFHVIIHKKIKNCPEWLNEGLALCFADQIEIINYQSRFIFPKKNIYELNYNDENFYGICGYLVNKIIEKYGFDNILERIMKDSIENDELLGKKNIEVIANKYFKDHLN